MMRDRLQQIVRDEHRPDGSGGETIGIIDETSAVKKGDKTPGVQRQHCGAAGKQENCIVLVNLAYACGDFHCLLDGDLWFNDKRCAPSSDEFKLGFVEGVEFELEIGGVAVSVGLAFHGFNLVVGPLQRSGRNRILVPVEDPAAVSL